jgi:hypothetical protein
MYEPQPSAGEKEGVNALAEAVNNIETSDEKPFVDLESSEPWLFQSRYA